MVLSSPMRDFLLNHAALCPVSFHMPGHKGAGLYREKGFGDFLDRIMDCDVTEIIGADNLFQPEGIIKEVQQKYAKLYEVKDSYLLINGTSGGIIASILASVKRGGKIIMARNCHKSVFNGLVLGDIEPVYAYPEKNQKYDIAGEIAVDVIARLLKTHEDAQAVILPSPNYYGICSDIKGIAEEVHRHGKTLIVDQAHGAHLKFFGKYCKGALPQCAEEAGADLVINSVHKTLASFTQSAVLNRVTDRIPAALIEDKLQAVESTSPSYLLMASLDINASIIESHGKVLFRNWHDNLKQFYEKALAMNNLNLMPPERGLDWSKINFKLGEDVCGSRVEKILMEEYGIFIELFTGSLVMCMSGIGNTASDYEALYKALARLARGKREQEYLRQKDGRGIRGKEIKVAQMPDVEKKTYHIPKERQLIPLTAAVGRICAGSIIPYPPGIPFFCPGEKITDEGVKYIMRLREMGDKVVGVTEEGLVFVGSE